MTIETNPLEGWTWIVGATKWHYFRERRSLCGRWLLLGTGNAFEQGKNDSPDNCALCRRLLFNESKPRPMTLAQAREEAKKRWGDMGHVRRERGEGVYSVGKLIAATHHWGNSKRILSIYEYFILGTGSTFEQAFADADDPNYRGSVVVPLTSKKRAVAIAEVASKVAPDGCRVVVSLVGSKKLIEFN